MVQRIEIQSDSLIARHQADTGGFADSFMTKVPAKVTIAEFVVAFYSTPLFRAERFILNLFGRGATDEQVTELVEGRRDDFAVWTVKDRRDTELLLGETSGATASWFMIRELPDGTELCFGSAVTPKGPGSNRMPLSYRLLLGLHLAYSRALLGSAARRLRATG